MVAASAWHAYEEANARFLTALAHDETGLGEAEDGFLRYRSRIIGTLTDLHGVVTTGVIAVDPSRGIRRLAKPIGVIAAIAPSTAPAAAIVQNALFSLKTRNAIVVCPNPSARHTATAVVDVLRAALSEIGAPEDLLQCVAEPSRDVSEDLMRAADMILAAGGQNMVRRAYSSGKPAYGAGVGNAVVIIDETADLNDACGKVVAGKAFDNGTSCSSESCLLVAEEVWSPVMSTLRRLGAHICTEPEARRLRSLAWPGGTALNREIVGKSAQVVARMAGIDVAPQARVLVATPEEGLDEDPFGTEKLSPILAAWRYHGFERAVSFAGRLTSRSGRGHSCGIHTTRGERVQRLAEAMEVSRVLVNQSTGFGNSGNLANGMPFTATLCCGTWGGSVSNENVTWRHLLNYTWVSEPIQARLVDEAALFAPYRAVTG
jgi:sulfoacetaldehyde dehydrogenase